MKNKKFTYFVLLPAVLFVWSLIVYRILEGRNEDFIPSKVPNFTQKLDVIIENKDYQLLNNYEDPFSVRQFNTTVHVGGNFVPKIQIKWPEIRLNGYVENEVKIKCHLTINNEDKILQENERILEDFIISKITPDSVKITCKGDSRWYKN